MRMFRYVDHLHSRNLSGYNGIRKLFRYKANHGKHLSGRVDTRCAVGNQLWCSLQRLLYFGYCCDVDSNAVGWICLLRLERRMLRYLARVHGHNVRGPNGISEFHIVARQLPSSAYREHFYWWFSIQHAIRDQLWGDL